MNYIRYLFNFNIFLQNQFYETFRRNSKLIYDRDLQRHG
jgi:hypothetical protein